MYTQVTYIYNQIKAHEAAHSDVMQDAKLTADSLILDLLFLLSINWGAGTLSCLRKTPSHLTPSTPIHPLVRS